MSADSVTEWNDELEAAIVRTPDVDAPYLVYADWLQTHGNPAGELIALQHSRRWSEAFIEEHFASWFGAEVLEAQNHGALRLKWQRGFVETIRCDSSRVIELVLSSRLGRMARTLEIASDRGGTAQGFIDAVVKCAPKLLGRLEVTRPRSAFGQRETIEIGNVGRLWREVPSLRDVVLNGSSAELGDIHAPELHTFALETSEISNHALDSIRNASWPKLVSLRLAAGQKPAQVLASLWAPSLTYLGLLGSTETDELVGALATSKVLPQLQTLDLSHGSMTARGVDTLVAHLAAFKHLSWLNLAVNALDPASVKTLEGLGMRIETHAQRDLLAAPFPGEVYDDEFEDED